MPSLELEHLETALAGRYTILRELGQGGMATVYLAEDIKHGRPVALKVLRPELASMLGSERFTREIQVAAGLNHPHVLPLYDSGSADGLLFYVMPPVRGESLRQRLRRERQLPVDEAIRLTRQVAAALDHAHSRGLIHRDIKPENILLHEGEAMVTDFGIALASSPDMERLTRTGMAIGTPEYMSPEQSAGERTLDARSDIYSLACVLYELLAGEPPYTGPTAHSILAKRFTDPVPRVRRLRPTVPLAVEEALLKALAAAPADRFATASEFADALTAREGGASRGASVAVLPFRNLSPSPDNEFFADGITEDVIAQLSKIRSLKVISSSSVMQFKGREQGLRQIGATLQVGTLLDGSIRRAGDRVRIVAQLIDAESDKHLWSETYDRQLTDIFAIQSDVALQIASALKSEMSLSERSRIQREPTKNVQAYQLLLRGRQCYSRYTEDGIRRGIQYYRQAIEADPNYALAHVGLALAFAELAAGQGGGDLQPDKAYHHALKAVHTALALDSQLGEAHSVLALLKFTHDFDWKGAEEEFKLALELSPSSADTYDHYNWLCAAQERYDEAVRYAKRAQELDPLTHRADVATALLRAGRHAEALEAAQIAVEFEPEYPRGLATLGWAYMESGKADQGIPLLEQASRLTPGNTLHRAQLAQAYAMVGRTEDARRIVRELEELSRQRYVSPYHMAYPYTGLGENERAIDFLERSYEERAGSVYGIKGSFLFTSLRLHPRFKELLRKMNLQ